MGIAFIEAKAAAFKQQRDAAFEEQLASGGLFSGIPETISALYRCKSSEDTIPEIGTPVLLYQTPTGIEGYFRNKLIGSVMSPDSAELTGILVQLNTEFLAARICECRPLSGVFLVRLQLPQA